MNWGRWDAALHRLAAIMTILGVLAGLPALYFAYRSLSTELQNLQYSQEQLRPRLDVSGVAFIDRQLQRARLEIIVVNKGVSTARDVAVHLEAIFRNESKPRLLGQFSIEEVDTVEPKNLSGPTVTSTFVDWLKRAMPLYSPGQHGPSKLVVYLEYKDGLGLVWGGKDETGKDRRGIVRRDLRLTVE